MSSLAPTPQVPYAPVSTWRVEHDARYGGWIVLNAADELVASGCTREDAHLIATRAPQAGWQPEPGTTGYRRVLNAAGTPVALFEAIEDAELVCDPGHDHTPVHVMDDLHNAPCPRCGGEGAYEVEEVTNDPDAIEPATHLEPCCACRATGYSGEPWTVAA